MRNQLTAFLLLLNMAQNLPGFGKTGDEEQPTWLSGFAKALGGHDFSYHSPQPNVHKSLLVRANREFPFIAWETEAVPSNFSGEFANFMWMFAIDANADSQPFDFFIDGRKWFTFTNPQNTDQLSWQLEKDGLMLQFRATMIDKYDDLLGYAALRVPRALLRPGKGLVLKVVGKNADSNAWYMTYQSAVKQEISLQPRNALLRENAVLSLPEGIKLNRPVRLNVVHLGEPLEGHITVGDWGDLPFSLQFGYNSIEFFIPEVHEPTELSAKIVIGDQPAIIRKCLVQPLRKWVIYLVMHTHTDIGYTRPQTEILPEHLRYIDYALDFCDQTDHYPDDARFRWTCENSWAVREYLKSRPPAQIDRLKRRVQEGRIQLTGMFLNYSEIIDENLLAAQLQPLRQIKERLGQPVSTAMQNDINGAGWCLVDYFHGAGIKYLTMGEHGHRALIPFDKPTAFWWESPSGNRILAYRAEHYMTGNTWGIHTGKMDTFEDPLLDYLSQLEEKNYSLDRAVIQYSGYLTDNSPPGLAGMEVIKTWNEKYAWPRLRSATAQEFLEYVEANHARELPVIRAAWPDWWTDGFGSVARETAAARQTQVELSAVSSLMVMAQLLGSGLPASFERDLSLVEDGLLFWDEHTVGAAESISDPSSENSVVQWQEKAAYAWDAVKRVNQLRERAMGFVQTYLPQADVPLIAVFNTLNHRRSGLAEVFIDHEILPTHRKFRIVDEGGRELAVQPLRGAAAPSWGNRQEGSYWALWVEDLPPMGYKMYRIEVSDAQSDLLPCPPDLHTLESDFYKLTVDPQTGALKSLIDKELGRELVDQQSPWQPGQFIYERLTNRAQLEAFRLADPAKRSSLSAVSVERGQDGSIWQSLVVNGQLPDCCDSHGVTCEIRLFHHHKRLEFHFKMRKLAVEDPEAIYVAFPFESPDGELRFEVQGGTVRPGKDQIPGTATDWNTVQNFVSISNQTGQLVFVSPEIPLVHLGGINIGNFDYIVPEIRNKPHIFSWVMNNYWTTNFKASQDGEFRWHYCLTSSADRSGAFATAFALGTRLPLLTRVLPAGQRDGKSSYSALPVSWPKNVWLINARPSANGLDVILHLREVNGEAARVALPDLPVGRIQSITEVNVLEEYMQGIDQEIIFKPNEIKFFKLQLAKKN